MSTPTAPARTFALPSARALIGGVYALCVLVLVAVFAGEILISDNDPYRNEGPVDSIRGIATVGTIALALGVLLSRWLIRSPARARVGAILLGALAVVSLPFFWSGAPGIFGACAAWLAGLTRGDRPLAGTARVAGLVGLFIAVLNIVLSLGGVVMAAFTGWD